MIYEADIILILKTTISETIIDELDEDSIALTPLKDKTIIRSSNKGTIIGSSIPRVPYDIAVNYMPSAAKMLLMQQFYNVWNMGGKPKINIKYIEKIDGVPMMTEFDQGVFKTELTQDTAGSETAPKYSFVLSATRISQNPI